MRDRRNTPGVIGLVVVLVVACLAGCHDGRSGPPVRTDVTAETRMTVHELTRVELEGEDRGKLVVHVALHPTEGAGEVIRPLGVFRVRLYRPVKDSTGGSTQSLDRSWEVDLRDPAKNAAAYDEFITRTYVLKLPDVPEWLRQWARASGAAADRPSVVVEFTPSDVPAGAEPITLRVGVPLTR